jgi:hypothetical protein
LFKISVGISTKSHQGEMVMDFGAEALLSDSAIVKVNLADGNDNHFSGWTPIFRAKPFKVESKFSAELDIYVQWTFGPSIKVFGTGVEAVLLAKLPELGTTIDSYNGPDTACANKKLDGISIGTSIGCAFTLRAGTSGDLAVTADLNTTPLFGPKKRSLDMASADGRELASRDAVRLGSMRQKTKRQDIVQRDMQDQRYIYWHGTRRRETLMS